MVIMTSFLLAQVFTFCPALTFYDQPNGNIVQIEGTPNVSMSSVYYEYDRNPSRLGDLGWTEVMLVGGRGHPISSKTYWVKSKEMCGKFIGR